MINNQSQIKSIELDDNCLKLLPESVRGVLSLLEEVEGIAIKGGIAKLCLMAAMRAYGGFKNEKRWKIEEKINDIDLVFVFLSNKNDLKESIINKYRETEKNFFKNGLCLHPKDIDIVEAENSKSAIENILGSNDLTINEVALVFSNGHWKIFYSPFALRHLAQGIGMFAKPKTTNLYYNAGRVFPSPLGFIRLLKFLVAGKVNKIYLPRWWITLYLQNYQKKVASGEMPANAPLGFYSLVLLKNYFGGDLLAQKRAMIALYDLGFTDMVDPELYIRQQERIFANAGTDFSLTNFSIEQVVDRYLESKKKKEESQKSRQAARTQCEHQFETINCDLCGKNQCAITTCAKCGKNKSGGVLPCVSRMRQGVIDPAGFYEIN